VRLYQVFGVGTCLTEKKNGSHGTMGIWGRSEGGSPRLILSREQMITFAGTIPVGELRGGSLIISLGLERQDAQR